VEALKKEYDKISASRAKVLGEKPTEAKEAKTEDKTIEAKEAKPAKTNKDNFEDNIARLIQCWGQIAFVIIGFLLTVCVACFLVAGSFALAVTCIDFYEDLHNHLKGHKTSTNKK
jgi:hypothetical protein